MRTFHNLLTFGVIALLVLVLWGTHEGNKVLAQDGGDTFAEQNVEKSPALIDFEKRLNRTGAVVGPFDITVFPSTKGANGMRYNDVPYVQFIGNSVIAFPVGKDRFGNIKYIYSSCFLLEVHPNINPAERKK